MQIYIYVYLLFPVLVAYPNVCPISILPDFCNDQEDSRCTSRFYYSPNDLSFGKNHPSEPRQIKRHITYTKDHFKIVNITWKPPNDSSISDLRGYEIGIPDLTWKTYIYNLTKAHLTINDSETVFSFACKLNRHVDPIICLHSLPIPNNSNFYCPETGPQTTEEVTTWNLTYTWPTIPFQHSFTKPNNSNLWYILIGMGVFVLTIIVFALFLLKDKFCKEALYNIEDELERINAKNSNYPKEEEEEEMEAEEGDV